MSEETQNKIHEKGFKFYNSNAVTQYGDIKIGNKTLSEAVLDLGSLQQYNRFCANKGNILRALSTKDMPTLREISKFFYRTNGIYSRVCNYVAQMYRYDWYVVPEIFDDSIKEEKILTDFTKILSFLDNSHIKKVCGDIALEVIKMGAYYGYMIPSDKSITLQQLPIGYCRTRFLVGDSPVVEFNMKFFDDAFPNLNYRMKILKMFPAEFQKGYVLYKQQKLPADTLDAAFGSWYALDPNYCVKFNIYNDDIPLFVNAIPSILDLDAAQDLDRRKQMQQLLKILVQQLPLDKNSELIFDVEEARDIHENAVDMMRHAIGVDVLTTFAEVEIMDLADKNTTATQDDLEKVERTVFNNLGVAENLFNSDGNIAMQNSILNDEAMIRTLLFQFNNFFDKITQLKSKNKKKYNFRLYMLETTQYNYKELAKMYKEQVQIGYSKMLPQIAMGHSQSSIIHTAYFENEILHLSEIMIPPLMSSTLNGEDILKPKSAANASSDKQAGRPEKEANQQSEKTIANKESMS